jgi:hypothetical protein
MKNFYEINNFNFLNLFKNNIDSIINEYTDVDHFKKLEKYFYVENKNQEAVFSSKDSSKIEWKSMPIYCGVNKEVEKNSIKYFKNTISFINEIKNKNISINSAQFCKLNRYCYFPRHLHKKNGFVIFHLLLFDLDKVCLYESNNEYKEIKNKGDYVIFPLNKMHSVYNFSSNDKISFSISFYAG